MATAYQAYSLLNVHVGLSEADLAKAIRDRWPTATDRDVELIVAEHRDAQKLYRTVMG